MRRVLGIGGWGQEALPDTWPPAPAVRSLALGSRLAALSARRYFPEYRYSKSFRTPCMSNRTVSISTRSVVRESHPEVWSR